MSAAIQEALKEVGFTIRYVERKGKPAFILRVKLSAQLMAQSGSNDTRQNKIHLQREVLSRERQTVFRTVTFK